MSKLEHTLTSNINAFRAYIAGILRVELDDKILQMSSVLLNGKNGLKYMDRRCSKEHSPSFKRGFHTW